MCLRPVAFITVKLPNGSLVLDPSQQLCHLSAVCRSKQHWDSYDSHHLRTICFPPPGETEVSKSFSMCQTRGCIFLDDILDALLCCPLSHTAYHQECRMNPSLFTRLHINDDGVGYV